MRITIKVKLAAAFGFLISALVGTAGYGIYSLSSANSAMEYVTTVAAARLDKIQQLNALSLNRIRAAEEHAARHDPDRDRKILQFRR